MPEIAQKESPAEGKPFLLDPYREWTQGEGISVHLDFGHDLITLETGPWERYGARGYFAFTHGAGDFMSDYVIEVPAGRKTTPIRHLYEAFFYVLGLSAACDNGARS